MAIAAVNGQADSSTIAVTTKTETYTPTAGSTRAVVAFFISAGAVTSLVVKDNLNNVLTVGSVSNNLAAFYQFPVPAGVTSYVATWTGSQQCSFGVEEYSGVVSVNGSFPGNTATGSSNTATIVERLARANNFIVAGMGSANTLTASVGNQRQQTTTATARIVIIDNTSASLTSVTNTATLTSAAWDIVAIELGLGTPSDARDSSDLELTISVNPSHARASQDFELALNKPPSTARTSSDLVLYLISNPLPSTALLTGVYADYQRRPKRHPITSFSVDSLFPISGRRRPIVFVVS